MDELTLTLNHPLTDEEWDAIVDVDFEYTNEITFYTKNGKKVDFVKEPHWIPTSKERPPQHQEIWITDVYGDVEVVYRGDGRLWHSNGDNGYYFEDEIIAWMPASVPSPYQPEEETE